MPEGFSFNREFDFVRLDGLRRATGRPPHEWDIYIVKELVDNALDADDTVWRADREKPPRLTVRLEYRSVPASRSKELFVQVTNQTTFPVGQLSDIFATQRYTSRKAFIKGLTRGSLGNALKTLLGIPYALRHRVAGDWAPAMNPLSLSCGGQRHLPRYVVDAAAQTIRFEFTTEGIRHVDGTEISVGLDHFEQEKPRTLADIQRLAEQYHLSNPHAWFNWVVEIDKASWEMEYAGDPGWAGKFRGVAPVHWYSQTAFQDLLGALHRERYRSWKAGALAVADIATQFAGYVGEAVATDPSLTRVASVIRDFGQSALSATEIDSQPATRLYGALCRHSPRFDSAELGAIGRAHVGAALARALPCTSTVLYDRIEGDDSDPALPFVIEAAVARLADGKRQMWTAINYTPTYGDPFLSRWLPAPNKGDEPVLGLRGLLDAYEIQEDAPVALFLHLICPNVEHHEFSKTEIDHLPFKHALGRLLDQLLNAFREAREEEELRLEQTVFQALSVILDEIGEDERFVFDQLLEKLRARLSMAEALAAWLETPQALGRLQAYVNSYQSRHAVFTHRVARPAACAASLPLHPDRHISVSAEYVSRDLLAEHYVNKLLYVQPREMEPVVIENNWLCRMDMALLHNPAGRDGLREAVVQCAASCDLIMLLHDADGAGHGLAEETRGWLAERQIDPGHVVDLGLETGDPSNEARPGRLVQMMPSELAVWLARRFESLGIRRKMVPPVPDIRRDIREQFERLLLGHLWEGMSQQLEVTRLVSDLDGQLSFTAAMRARGLDQELSDGLEGGRPAESYAAVLEQVVKDFFRDFMCEHSASVEALVRAHLARMQDGPS